MDEEKTFKTKKIFKGVLLLNYKTGEIKARKRFKQSDLNRLSPFWIPIKYEITVNIPERKEAKLTGEITLKDTQVAEMVLEEL